jgi:hypothetical protein
LVELLKTPELIKFIHQYSEGSTTPKKPTKNPPTEAEFKHGRDDHGSNEIFTYKVQIRSIKKSHEQTGTLREVFQPFIQFTHGMITSLGHVCRFIQYHSRDDYPPIDCSDDLPDGAELLGYEGSPKYVKNEADMLRSFFFKVQTSYPKLSKLHQQEVIVNERHEKAFQNYLTSASLAMEVFLVCPQGKRPRKLLRGITPRTDPELVKAELMLRMVANGVKLNEDFQHKFHLEWSTCATPPNSAQECSTSGLCLFCAIEDDELIEDAIQGMARADAISYPLTHFINFVDAAYTKDSTATQYQYYMQLKYQKEWLEGLAYLTVQGIPASISPFQYKPESVEGVELKPELAQKVVLESMSIGQIMMMQQYHLGEDAFDSPIIGVHKDRKTSKWYFEASDAQADTIALLAPEIQEMLTKLLGDELKTPFTVSKEGIISAKKAKLDSVKQRREKQHQGTPKDQETETMPSTEASLQPTTPQQEAVPSKEPTTPPKDNSYTTNPSQR